MNEKLKNLFKETKPIIGMIHLKGNSSSEILELAKKEIVLLTANGIDAVLIENYFGSEYDVEKVLAYLNEYQNNIVYGINILGDYEKSFVLANKYDAKFIQVDSVSGHLPIDLDNDFGKEINELRETSSAALLGGVRFKYQPYLSGRSLKDDIEIGISRCDAIVVTGLGTGKETEFEKINMFKALINNKCSLVIGAGLNLDNCYEQLLIADAGIVGSYLKDTGRDNGDISEDKVDKFMQKVKTLRKTI
jgi:uncharacterized protein